MTKKFLAALAIAAPALLMLAACAPTPAPSPAVTAVADPPAEPIETDEPAPVVADYLVEFSPADAASEASELSHYAFWTDDSKAVRCDIYVGGQSDPFTSCIVMPDFESSVTYALPSGSTPDCEYSGVDGYEVGLNAIPADAGYDAPRAQAAGCSINRVYPTAEIAAATLVLPPGAALDFGPFRCSVADAVATCEYPETAASVSLGLSRIAAVN